MVFDLETLQNPIGKIPKINMSKINNGKGPSKVLTNLRAMQEDSKVIKFNSGN